MLKQLPRLGRAFLLAFPIAAGGIAVMSNPHPAAAQATAPTCWAEWCEGNACVRIKIQCPPVISPIT